jgi:TrmH family RNA methyltransferase
MITKAELKYYSSLLKKNFRDEQNKFLIEGEKLILEALVSRFECEVVIFNKDFAQKKNETVELLSKQVHKFEIVSEKEFQKVQATVNSQGIIGVFIKKSTKASSVSVKGILIAALDGINDPGNVGTIIRNADWFGVKEILLSTNCADVYNPKTIRASAGSMFHLTLIIDDNLIHSLTSLKQKGYRILCADITGQNIYQYEKSEKEIIVFSNEANGPTSELLHIADVKLTVPKKGKAESLNVASASAVILSELTKSIK